MSVPIPTLNSTAEKEIRIALAGNPNCGKTTLFNSLTGLSYKVANYPGVTVEKKFGKASLPNFGTVDFVDLPGTYSLFGHSLDEQIASKAILGQLAGDPLPDIIVSVIDANNLERNLYLTTQLIDLGLPIVVALNMTDVAERNGVSIKVEILSRLLDLPIVPIVASKGQHLDLLKAEISATLTSRKASSKKFAWLNRQSYRDLAEKVGQAALSSTESWHTGSALLLGASLLSESISPASTASAATLLEDARRELKAEGIDPLSFEVTSRYQWVNTIVSRSCTIENTKYRKIVESIDSVLTHKISGSIIFLLIMTFIFQSIFLWASVPMEIIDSGFSALGQELNSLLPEGKLRSLIVDGVVAGVGSVLIFIPQIAVLFFFLSLLEDSGYLSRAAFLMDNLMRKFGLQGRSFIPLLSSFACAIPGIMSTRSIPSWADRMTTILVAPFMSCSARLPVYAVLISAFIPRDFLFGVVSLQGLVLLSMYLLGIIGAALVAWIIRYSFFRGEPAMFVMEMPGFRTPSVTLALRQVWDRVLVFLKSAGTMILACSIVLWFLASYPSEKIEQSYAGRLGRTIEPIIKPLGYNWEVGVGLIASFAAREVFVSSLATVYSIQDQENSADSLTSILKQKKASGEWGVATALSLMVFYVFACQCMSTLAVCRRETGSWAWTAFMFSYMTGMAYVAAFATYHLSLIVLG